MRGLSFFVVGQVFHLDWTEHVHVVHLSELLGHSCFALFFELFNTWVHRVMHESNSKRKLLPILLGKGFVLLRSSAEKKTHPSRIRALHAPPLFSCLAAINRL